MGVSIGLMPGRMYSIVHYPSPISALLRMAGISPAKINELFPEPDGPITARNRDSAIALCVKALQQLRDLAIPAKEAGASRS